MQMRQFGILMLGVVLATGTVLAQNDSGAKQDMKNAGHETKDAAVDAGHGVKQGSKKAYHKTKHGTKRAAHKVKNTVDPDGPK